MKPGDSVRVVRSNGEVEYRWEFAGEFDVMGTRRVAVRMWSDSLGDFLVKNPRKELFDHWQNGGMSVSTQEYREFVAGGDADG